MEKDDPMANGMGQIKKKCDAGTETCKKNYRLTS